jgi:hypothetical protein
MPKTLTAQQIEQALSSSNPEKVRLACDYLEAEARRSGDIDVWRITRTFRLRSASCIGWHKTSQAAGIAVSIES